jgi:hypothetical protein
MRPWVTAFTIAGATAFGLALCLTLAQIAHKLMLLLTKVN